MNRRAGPTPAGEPGSDLQDEVAVTKSAVAGLLRLLRRPGVLEQPSVLGDICKLESFLWSAFEQKGSPPGRHRAPSASHRRTGAADHESELKPDPSAAQTPAEFVLALRRLKAWSGLSLRAIAAGAKQKRVHTTIQNAMKHETLPTLEVVHAIVTGCGGSEEDLRAFTATWHRLNASDADDAEISAMLSAPVPVRQMAHSI